MKFVIAADSFKGALDASPFCDAVEAGIRRRLPDAPGCKLPLADGGEGTVHAVCRALGGSVNKEKAIDPFGNSIDSYIGFCHRGKTAVIDTAAASSLATVKSYPSFSKGGIFSASTYGTGLQIRRALDHGCNKIIVGLGGSGTNDGGAGAAQALGIKYYDKDRQPVDARLGPSVLDRIAYVDTDELMPPLGKAEISLIYDVDIPLTGDSGCSVKYSKQKGASVKDIEILEHNITSFSKACARSIGSDLSEAAGAGAAGGLGFGLSLCGGVLRPGAEYILELYGFDTLVKDADAVITGEGKCDAQTADGKLPACVARRTKMNSNAPVICLCGISDPSPALYDVGIDAVFALCDRPMLPADSLKNTALLARKAAFNIAGLVSALKH